MAARIGVAEVLATQCRPWHRCVIGLAEHINTYGERNSVYFRQSLHSLFGKLTQQYNRIGRLEYAFAHVQLRAKEVEGHLDALRSRVDDL